MPIRLNLIRNTRPPTRRLTSKPSEAAQYRNSPLNPDGPNFMHATLDGPFRQLVCMAGESRKTTELDRLISQFQAAGPRERILAFADIVDLKDKRAAPFLAEILETDQEYRIRCQAAIALGKLKSRNAVASLIRTAQNDPFDHVRSSAIVALGEIKDKKTTTPPLIDIFLNDSHDFVRITAAGALGRMKARRAVPHLLASLMSDPDFQVREGIANGLVRIGGTKTAEDIIEAVVSGHPLQEDFIVGHTLWSILESHIEKRVSSGAFFIGPTKETKKKPVWVPTIPASFVERFKESKRELEEIKTAAQKMVALFMKTPKHHDNFMHHPLDHHDHDLPFIRRVLSTVITDNYKIVKTYEYYAARFYGEKEHSRENQLTHFFMYLLASTHIPLNALSILNNKHMKTYAYYEFASWNDFWQELGYIEDPNISIDDLALFVKTAMRVDAALERRSWYTHRFPEPAVKPKKIHFKKIIKRDHLQSVKAAMKDRGLMEWWPQISRGPAFERASRNGQAWEYDIRKVCEYKGFVSKRIDPLAVNHPAEEIKVANRIGRKLQKAEDSRFKIQEFIGFVAEGGNFYLLSKKEEGTIDLWELFQNPIPLIKRMFELNGSVTTEELIAMLAEIKGAHNWLKEFFKDDLKDLDERNVLVKLLDNGELEFTLIDFETS
ncbi:MAG: HEAT repeat domain-containing protein [Candidatus Margulisiibacteriota bacterium]